jgi:hypothetical protein
MRIWVVAVYRCGTKLTNSAAASSEIVVVARMIALPAALVALAIRAAPLSGAIYPPQHTQGQPALHVQASPYG